MKHGPIALIDENPWVVCIAVQSKTYEKMLSNIQEIKARGGIVIDDACRTSDPRIYAIGECALWGGKIFGLFAPGYQMAQAAAGQLAGRIDATFTGADMSTKLKLMGVDVASLGDAHAAEPGARCYSFVDERKQIYKKIIVSDDGKRLLGGILVGTTEGYDTWLPMMLNGIVF